MQQLETTIASLTKRGEQLAAKRVTTQETLDEAIKTRQQALLSGDLDDQRALDKLQDIVNTAASALAGIEDALAVLAHRKAEAERQLAAERERIKRAAAADKLDEQVGAIEATLPSYIEQSRALADALSEVSYFHFEAGQMASFVQNAMGQIEVAANFTLADLKNMPPAIRDGRQAIPRKPDAEPVAVIEPAPPSQTVFMLRSAKYRDHDGRTRYGGQYEDATMPVPTAQRALRCGAAVPTTDDRRRNLRGARGGDFNFAAPDVVDLDAVEEPTGVLYIGPDTTDPVLREAGFHQIDRSAESRVIKIAVPRV
ncbi:hypothetical protein V1281_003137 [Nitrobacteraceae bacterium AZCC 2161]